MELQSLGLSAEDLKIWPRLTLDPQCIRKRQEPVFALFIPNVSRGDILYIIDV